MKNENVIFNNIPLALRDCKAWLVWRSEPKKGETKPSKIPYYINGKRRSGTQGEPKDLESLGTFEGATNAFGKRNYTGLGFAMSATNGLICIDLDHCISTDGTYSQLAQEIIAAAGNTYAEVSPSGDGLHIWLRGSLPNTKNVLGGIEVFCSTGYLTMTGKALDGVDSEIAQITPESIDTVNKYISIKPLAEDKNKSRFSEGGRNNALTSEAGKLRSRGLDTFAIESALMIMNQQRCKPPLSESEVSGIANGIGRYPAGRICSDLGNAERLIDACNGSLLFCAEVGRWLCWSESRWLWDKDGMVHRAMREVIRNIYIEATSQSDEGRRATLTKWATKSESKGALRAAVDLAENDARVLVKTEELDASPWLLGVKNGSLDLKTGLLITAQPEQLITKQAPVLYDATAKCPTWTAFLDKIFDGDAVLISYLQRAIGYTLTGNTLEKCLFFLYGKGGNNGKSTLIETLMSLLGDYAIKERAETFMQSKNGNSGATPERVRLRGARLVVASELSDGQRFDECFIKDITGGIDQISARGLYSNPISFKPEFKFWIYGNHRPKLRTDDDAIWRRLHSIPFEVSIQANEQDHALAEKLLVELPGILNWALVGLMDWQNRKLDPPEKVRAAVCEYREDMDDFGKFLDECVDIIESGSHGEVPAGVLYQIYQNWTQKNGMRPLSNTNFSRRFTDRGFESRIRDGRKLWCGIKVISNDDVF